MDKKNQNNNQHTESAVLQVFAEEFDTKDVIRGVTVDETDPTPYNDTEDTIINVDPFSEEFDKDAVVNRQPPSDYIIDDLLKIQQEKESIENSKLKLYISKKELDAILMDNPRIQFFHKNDDASFEEIDADNIVTDILSQYATKSTDDFVEIILPPNINEPAKITEQPKTTATTILDDKSTTDDNDEYYRPTDNFDDNYDEEEEIYYMTPEEVEKQNKIKQYQKTLAAVKDKFDELNKKNNYIDPEKVLSEFLQTNFKDYLLAKKIAGNADMRSAEKIITEDKIIKTEKTIEISDAHSLNPNLNEKTSVLINRDENMDIDSIEIFCKCGEKTIIRFHEDDTITTDSDTKVENNSLTDIVFDTVDVMPMLKDNEVVPEFIDKKISDNI